MKTTNKLLVTFFTIITLTSCNPDSDDCSINYEVVPQTSESIVTNISLDYCSLTFTDNAGNSGTFSEGFVLQNKVVKFKNAMGFDLWTELTFILDENNNTITVFKQQ